MELAPDTASYSIWFCGPEMFRKMIEKGMKRNNMTLKKLHYDNFSFR